MTDPVGAQPMLRLMAMLPAATRAEMVRMYTELLAVQLPATAARLHDLADPEVLAQVHKLAGSAAMMQDADLSQPARAMERALREQRPGEALALWPQVEAAAARTLAVLATLDQ